MAVKFETVKAGDVLYDVHKQRLGNTTLSTVGVWIVKVIEVHPDHAICSWNGNPPEKYHTWDFKNLRRKEPKLMKTGFFGQWRLARKGE